MINNISFVNSVMLLLCALLPACGGGGSGSTGQAQSTTVALQAGVTAGKATIVQSQFTSASNLASFTPFMDFTLKSVVNPNAGSTASDVNITSEVITYEYLDSQPLNLGVTLQIPPLVYYSNLIVPAGGTSDWQNVPVLTLAQKQYLKANNPNATQMRFKVKITFNGYEVKNGSNVSVTTTGTLLLNQ